MVKFKKTIEWIIASSMVSCSVQLHQKPKVLQALHTTSWRGKMEKYSLNPKIMALFTYMISTVLFRDLNLILHVQELKIFKFFLRQLDTQFWFGPRISTILRVKVTMESILFNM
jgi:hypothetical protein